MGALISRIIILRCLMNIVDRTLSLNDILKNKRAEILEAWRTAIIKTYPQDSSTFLNQQQNRFLNPIGNTVNQEVGVLFDCLTSENGQENVVESLRNILKIRAVQEFSPSEAIGFIFTLKDLVFRELEHEHIEDTLRSELRSFEVAVDSLALTAFDIYLSIREKIYQIRIEELKRMSFGHHGTNDNGKQVFKQNTALKQEDRDNGEQ